MHRHGRKVGILRVRRDGDAGDLQNGAVGRGDVQILRQRIAQGLLADGNLKCRRMRAERAVQLRRLLRDLRRALQGDEQRVRIFCTLVRAALERIGLAEQQAEAPGAADPIPVTVVTVQPEDDRKLLLLTGAGALALAVLGALCALRYYTRGRRSS